MKRTGSAPPTRRDIRDLIDRKLTRTNVAWHEYLDDVFPSDPTLCAMRAQNADLTPRVDEMKREFFAERGFAIRRLTPQRGTVPSVSRRARARSSHGNGRGHRAARSSARSGDSPESDEPEPPLGRFCAGCGRDISYRRADAKTCNATCRKRVERGAGVDALLNRRREAWQGAANDGGHPFLTYAVDQDLIDLYEEVRAATRSEIARERDFDVCDTLMRSNGVYVRRRPIAKEWRTRITTDSAVVVVA